MKKKFLLSLLLFPLIAEAQIQPGDSVFNVGVGLGYAHNLTYGSFMNVDIDAYMPINRYFDMSANVRLSATDYYTFGLQFTPKFPLPVGEMFLDGRMMARLIVHSGMNEALTTMSVGYRMQYVSVMLGSGTRLILPQPYDWHTSGNIICEPFTLIYRVEGFVRPISSPWNISLCISNIDTHQLERVWQPLFMIGGWYDFNPDWRLRANVECKPTGMFHLDATYYGIEANVMAIYRF